MQKIGILGAMREEIAPILELFGVNFEEISLGGNVFHKGIYNNKEIIVAYSKIGKVHSTLTTTSMILAFGVEKVLFSGVAGSLVKDLKINDLLVAQKLVQHDVDLSAFEHPLGFIPESEIFVKTCKDLNALAHKVANEQGLDLKEGIIASGDQFVHSKARKEFLINEFKASAVEMEGASVAFVCHKFDVPCCVLRSISDNADEEADVSFDDFLEESAKTSAKFLKSMVDKMD
ncbi:5'-methylthioadenosine/S-adenosylhomocysteine nucleosidase [Helicobacter cetorum MIT 99-5656]|uniref:adenosylhomocysteine nucleosidase n=2 Tax=Helicobacter cetorum TaxID=138563 RepID=I0ERZ9_HELCM|nr:5'-methylthioadenosine/S-adenosylhomocysteine nucleosidase [Helicobacter cetorum MIT 99-5656]